MSFSKPVKPEDEPIGSYQSNVKKRKSGNEATKRTNASRGSTFVLHRSKATPGISKTLVLPKAVSVEDKKDVRRRIYMHKCACKENLNCLLKCRPINSPGCINEDVIIDLVYDCRNSCKNQSKQERDAFLLDKVKSSVVSHRKSSKQQSEPNEVNQNITSTISHNDLPCFRSNTSVTEDGGKIIFSHKYVLPVSDDVIPSSKNAICRKCFCLLYGFTKYEVDQACTRLKECWIATGFERERWEDSRLHPYNYGEVEQIFSNNTNHDTVFTSDQPFDDSMITNSLLPVAEKDIDVALWLEDIFLTYGDHAPNRNIHQISSTFKRDVYIQYMREFEKLPGGIDRKPVDEQRFNEIWNACFPNYLVRPWANVTGKCDICYKIDFKRRTSTDKVTKEALRQAHLMHRGGLFMPERRRFVLFMCLCKHVSHFSYLMFSYKRRVLYALRNADRCMSLIWDGMDQNHSRCPHLGSQDEFAHPLKQHIQGVLVHGVGKIYL